MAQYFSSKTSSQTARGEEVKVGAEGVVKEVGNAGKVMAVA
jgi:hypothetical protein